jgi:hypothetical protein
MTHDEPTVQGAIRLIQGACLAGGMQLKYGHTPPTPRFAQHLRRHYLPFCRDVIASFLTVGFAPYRIRVTETGARVPELLPLGSYTWFIARNMNNIGQWGGENANTNNKHLPFLRYEINSMYCSDPIHVHTFSPPPSSFLCSSPLSSLLSVYEHLRTKRECCQRADRFNCNPSIVMEQHTKLSMNDLAKSGQALLDPEVKGRNAEKRVTSENQMRQMHDTLAHLQQRTHLPEDTVTLVAPTDYAIHSLDHVLSPQEMIREEMAFGRLVALCLGIPPSMLLQGASSVGLSSSAGNSAGSWAEGFEGSNRLLVDTCRHINMCLEDLMQNVHKLVYGSDQVHPATFQFPVVPTVPFEQLMTAYQAQLVDDANFSLILEATWGMALSQQARAVREQQQKAEYVLPFRDKKQTP